jgi:hypothetical protein
MDLHTREEVLRAPNPILWITAPRSTAECLDFREQLPEWEAEH